MPTVSRLGNLGSGEEPYIYPVLSFSSDSHCSTPLGGDSQGRVESHSRTEWGAGPTGPSTSWGRVGFLDHSALLPLPEIFVEGISRD